MIENKRCEKLERRLLIITVDNPGRPSQSCREILQALSKNAG